MAYEGKGNKVSIGGLWQNKGKSGDYLTGTFTKEKLIEQIRSMPGDRIKLLGFVNSYKNGDTNKPDWKLSLAEVEDRGGTQPQRSQSEIDHAKTPASKSAGGDDGGDDGIPF